MDAIKVALITGASGGIGRAIAFALAGQGYALAICAREQAGLRRAQDELSERFPNLPVLAQSVDCSVKSAVNAFAKTVDAEYSFVDVLVNNVGQYQPGMLLSEPDEAMEHLMQLNFFSAYYLSKYFGQKMASSQKGHIFMIGSIAGKEPMLGSGAYSISKFALLGLSRNLRQELKAYRVGVTTLLPGPTLSRSWDGSGIPDERFILPEDLARLVVCALSLSPGAQVDELEVRPLQ